jgi:uncharacterized protein (TIGR04255 family)
MHLSKAPIKEAVFEIVFSNDTKISWETLTLFTEAFKQKFPTLNKTERIVENKYTFQDVKAEASSAENIGVIYFNDEKTRWVQARLNAITVIYTNKTYTDWDSFKKEALDYVEFYGDFIELKNIQRISLRFVNEIDIPMDCKSLDEVTNFLPVIPPKIDGTLGSSFLNILLNSPKYEANASIRELFAINAETNTQSLILDIDVIKIFPDDKLLPFKKTKDLENRFDALREYKNEIFFNSITSATLERYK